MRLKFLFLVGLGVGYVLGARAGRPRYDRIKAKATEAWEDPRVQKVVTETQEFVKENAPLVQEKVIAGTKATVTGAQDAAARATVVARDVSGKVVGSTRDVSGKVVGTTKDVSGKVVDTTRGVSRKVAESSKQASKSAKKASRRVAKAAQDASESVTTTAKAVRDNIVDRGEHVVDGVIIAAGKARDEALDVETEDDEK